jgi:hypothetical protein
MEPVPGPIITSICSTYFVLRHRDHYFRPRCDVAAVRLTMLFFRAEDGESFLFPKRWCLCICVGVHCVITQKNVIISLR